MDEQEKNHFSIILINLLKGIIYRDKDSGLWQSLISLHGRVAEYAAVLGLECIVDEAEGYAYLRQVEASDGERELPQLMPRRQMNYTVSLLCVLLRKKIIESDSQGESRRVIVTQKQVVEMMRLYMPDSSNEAKVDDKIKAALNKIIDLGFIQPLDAQNESLEIKRILRAFVDANWISQLDSKLNEQLESYEDYANE
jgi:hypothetical protein